MSDPIVSSVVESVMIWTELGSVLRDIKKTSFGALCALISCLSHLTYPQSLLAQFFRCGWHEGETFLIETVGLFPIPWIILILTSGFVSISFYSLSNVVKLVVFRGLGFFDFFGMVLHWSFMEFWLWCFFMCHV